VKRILVPGVITPAVVVSLLALASWNRSDAPRLRITLSERELPASVPTPNSGDDRGAQLRVAFQNRTDALDARNWLTEERLRALGFALDVMPGAPEAMSTYSRALPRVAWVAFEFNGNAWRELERRRVLESTRSEAPERHFMTTAGSRLVPVDASSDLETLLARYPSGHLILRAVIALGYVPPSRSGPLVYGWIRELIPPGITVPRELRGRLTGGLYDVDLALGRLGIPYVTDIRVRQ
jgi:hypothetical protein